MAKGRFDDRIEAANAEFGTYPDWFWLKAQLMAESNLDPKAVSPVGAKGIAQFMDPTWGDVKLALGLPDTTTAFEPSSAIRGAAWLMAKMIRIWSHVPRAEIDRIRLGLACYNAGQGNVLRAQQVVKGALDYNSIINALRFVTGSSNAKQTIEYVARIERLRATLVSRGTEN